jgi:bromodomain and WD repeat domain containing protein 1/3
MDLQTVKEELISGNYDSPIEFAKDMRLIFQNSRSYNTNNRSRVSFRFSSSRFYHNKSLVLSSKVDDFIA